MPNVDVTSQKRTGTIIAFATFVALGLSFVLFAPPQASTPARAQSSDSLSGYAWSSNIGWISFNGPNYIVSISPTTGIFSGYAWSSNVGWISFNASTGCPVGTCNARLSGTSVLGWARALSNGDGWDGWIRLDGITLNGLNFEGYAWGSDVVGWLQFNPAFGGVSISSPTPPTVSSFTADFPSVPPGGSATLSWTSQNASSCEGSVSWSGTKGTSDSEFVGPLTNPTNVYRLTCINAFGSDFKDVTVFVQEPQDFSLTKSGNVDLSYVTNQPIQGPVTIGVAPVNNFGVDVSLSASSANPELASVTYDFSDLALDQFEYSTGSEFTLGSATPIPQGTYTVTVTGNGGEGFVRTIDISVRVGVFEPRFEEI